jgi:hypothetical protein
MENISEIVKAAEEMVERVGIFCRHNAAIEDGLKSLLEEYRKNTDRLVNGRRSIVKAALKAIDHGIAAPTGKNALPQPESWSMTEEN